MYWWAFTVVTNSFSLVLLWFKTAPRHNVSQVLNTCSCEAEILRFQFETSLRVKTAHNLLRWSSKVTEKTVMSSKASKQCSHCNPARTYSINRWKVAGALQIKAKWHYESWGVEEAVFCLSSGLTPTLTLILTTGRVQGRKY